MAEYRANNKDIMQQSSKNWKENNKAATMEMVNRRRAKKLQACPAWVDKAALRQVYELRDRLSFTIGVKFDVDHIVPLQHDLVCGLHVPWNLRPVPYSWNRRKGNKFMPGES